MAGNRHSNKATSPKAAGKTAAKAKAKANTKATAKAKEEDAGVAWMNESDVPGSATKKSSVRQGDAVIKRLL